MKQTCLQEHNSLSECMALPASLWNRVRISGGKIRNWVTWLETDGERDFIPVNLCRVLQFVGTNHHGFQNPCSKICEWTIYHFQYVFKTLSFMIKFLTHGQVWLHNLQCLENWFCMIIIYSMWFIAILVAFPNKKSFPEIYYFLGQGETNEVRICCYNPRQNSSDIWTINNQPFPQQEKENPMLVLPLADTVQETVPLQQCQ